MSKQIRVRFHGGGWDGYRVLPYPLPRVLVVTVPRSLATVWDADTLPSSTTPMIDTDEYHLEQYQDGTGILSWEYRLRRMVRNLTPD